MSTEADQPQNTQAEQTAFSWEFLNSPYPSQFLQGTRQFGHSSPLYLIDQFSGKRPMLLNREFLSHGSVSVGFCPTILMDSNVFSAIEARVSGLAESDGLEELIGFSMANEWQFDPTFCYLEHVAKSADSRIPQTFPTPSEGVAAHRVDECGGISCFGVYRAECPSHRLSRRRGWHGGLREDRKKSTQGLSSRSMPSSVRLDHRGFFDRLDQDGADPQVREPTTSHSAQISGVRRISSKGSRHPVGPRSAFRLALLLRPGRQTAGCRNKFAPAQCPCYRREHGLGFALAATTRTQFFGRSAGNLSLLCRDVRKEAA